MNIENCEVCLNSRVIISENGFHPICCLSNKKAMDCISGKKNYFITLKKDVCTNEEYETILDSFSGEYRF